MNPVYTVPEGKRGIAALEFALVLPLLMIVFLGIVEFARFSIAHQKIEKLVHSMADFTTQGTTVSTQDLATFSGVAAQIMSPLPFSGTIIFSSVVNNPASAAPCNGRNSPCIIWMGACLGNAASQLGVSGTSPPTNFPLVGMAAGQNVIVAELSYNYQPLISYTASVIPSLKAQTIYRNAVYKPRQGTLTTITNNGGGCTLR